LLENLLANGEVEEAERIMSSMDRAVYGYGASEFTNIELRIEQELAKLAPKNAETESVAAHFGQVSGDRTGPIGE